MSEVNCTGKESELASCERTDGEVICEGNVGAQALCEPCKKYIYRFGIVFFYLSHKQKYQT